MSLLQNTKTLTRAETAELLARAREASEMLKIMSHEGRLLILCFLLDGEKTVSELEALTSMAQATVSQHLARMRLDKLLGSRRDGRLIYYRIVDKKVAGLIATLYDLYCSPDQTNGS